VQLPKIRHWRIIEGDWHQAPNVDAHFHVDPPYSGQSGRTYKYNNAGVDFKKLAKWCRTRRGFIQVCENSENTGWLPFGDPYTLINSRRREFTAEVVWERESR
jgi:hypothetical protein